MSSVILGGIKSVNPCAGIIHYKPFKRIPCYFHVAMGYLDQTLLIIDNDANNLIDLFNRFHRKVH